VPVLEKHRRLVGDFQAGGLDFEELQSEMPQLLDYIIDGARRVKSIVADLKSYSRHTPAEMNQQVHINRVVQSAFTLTRNLIGKATENHRLRLGGGIPSFPGNIQRVEQVVVNLLINACEALPDRARAIELSTYYQADQGQVVVQVRDEGVGMDPETLSRVTDPFFTTKRDTGGTGLGLSVSAGIVEVHGGSMSFAPNPGHGVTVRVAFPVLGAGSQADLGRQRREAMP